MDYKKSNSNFDREKEILFSEAVKAGKRIYYLDVKRSRRDELFLSITESKKVAVEDGVEGQFNFEKHKIFLYKEDFTKFIDALSHAIRFIHENDGDADTFQPSDDEGAQPSDATAYDTPAADDLAASADSQPTWSQEPNEKGESSLAEEFGDEIDIKIDF